MFLLDSNIWMQLARGRQHAAEVRAFLAAVPYDRLSTIGTDIAILRHDVQGIRSAVETGLKLNLDYDDGYQYTIAERHNLALVSLDTDFDRTPRGRLTPAAALQRFTDEQQKQNP